MTAPDPISRNFPAIGAATRFEIQYLKRRPPVSRPAYAYHVPAKLPVGRSPSFEVTSSLNPQAPLFQPFLICIHPLSL